MPQARCELCPSLHARKVQRLDRNLRPHTRMLCGPCAARLRYTLELGHSTRNTMGVKRVRD